jgi:alkylhydroperoxidase family enzyme
MPLIPYADIAAAPVEVRDAMARMPKKLNIFRMLAHAKTSFLPALRLGGAILARQKLAPAMRELVILLVAQVEHGTYEWVQHLPVAVSAGCTEAQIAALEAGRYDAECFNAKEKALLRFAYEVIEEVRAGEETVKAAIAYFSAQEIVEIIVTCGYYMTLARITETTRVDVEPAGGSAVLEELGRLR